MSPERWLDVQRIFARAEDLDRADRRAFLDEACGADRELRAEVETLLDAAIGATSYLGDLVAGSARDLLDEKSLSGRRIGPYRLLRELGHGGMGAVYLAERDDQEYRTRVAIEVLPGGLETEKAIARFKVERQILATLEHPGIVRLLDGGTTDEGLPYLVMEAVDGVPITAYAAEHELSVRARVELFRKVCLAVQHAHAQLVIHRDIKPSNILVTPAGEPKLLDFGIAKLLDGGEGLTGPATQLFTPAYASPEQARGTASSTSTDVYSLGAVLYELLSGSRAIGVDVAGLATAVHLILEVEPVPLSAAAPAERRRALAGDLENIVARAMRKEPTQRYLSVEQLAEDLRRHLVGLPVIARAPTLRYRAVKLVRRHRAAAAAALLVVATLGAATGISLQQARRANAEARRAQRRFDDVRRLASSLLFDLDTKVMKLEGATEARELIVRRALEYLDGLAAEAGDDPALARDVALAYMKVGDIQGSGFVPNLGRPRDGLASYERAGAILDGLHATDEATRALRVRALLEKGHFYRAIGDDRAARRSFLDGLAGYESFPGAVAALPPGADLDISHVLVAYHFLALIERDMDRLEEAEAHSRKCLEGSQAWAAREPSVKSRYWVAVSRSMVGELRGLRGDPQAAVVENLRSFFVLETVAAEHPEIAALRRDMQGRAERVATYSSGKGDAALWAPAVGPSTVGEALLRRAVLPNEQVARRDTSDTRALEAAASGLSELAANTADPGEAADFFGRAIALYQRLPAQRRDSRYVRQMEWFAHCSAAMPLARLGRRVEALQRVTTGAALAAAAAADPTAVIEDQLHVLMCRTQLADLLAFFGDGLAAAALLDETAAALEPIVAAHPSSMRARIGLVATLERAAELRPSQACALRARAQAAWKAWPGEPTPYIRRRGAEIDKIVAACSP